MNVIIDKQKITDYLLAWKPKNDKSKFLNDLGYSLDNWEDLRADIENIFHNNPRVFQNATPFDGSLFQVTGKLRNFGVVSIWFLSDNTENIVLLHFIQIKNNTYGIFTLFNRNTQKKLPQLWIKKR